MPSLHPFAFHQNWKIILNEFYNIESTKETFDSDLKFYFMEDLLEIKNIQNGTFIHVGWYPEFDPEGSFKIVVFDSDYNGKLIKEFESKNREETANELSTLLEKYAKVK
jgi:hypothetical protein